MRHMAVVMALAAASPALAEEPMALPSGPIDLRPAAAAPMPAAKRKIARLAPPLPRPRPAGVAAAPPATETAGIAVAADAAGDDAGVDRSLQTGAIAEPAPAPAPPTAPPVAAAAKTAETDEPLSDGLPGDPGPATMPGGEPPAADASSSAGAAGEPYQMVRTLQMLQDQIAQGSMRALAAQKALRARIDAAFAAAPPATWQDGRNAAAAVTYALSGGSPAILEKLVVLDPKPEIDRRLLGGALAYISGREALANELLGPLNPFELPITMAGQVALAQSALAVRTDPAKAMALLDTARLLGTGTLVEEAALRREIFVADQLKQYDKVEKLARQYLDRFRHSVYAGNFRNRFAAAVTHMDFVKDADQFRRLDDMVASVEPGARCQIYLTVALASVVRGNGLAARLAAERAAALAENGSAEESRAALYRAAGGVADAKTFDEAAKALASVRTDQLSASDRALQAMVEVTIDGISSGTKVLAKDERQLAWLAGGKDDTATPIMKRAGDALKVADALLAAAPK
jgi:chemotaxis protein MotC